ncbi:hypothetical protein [Anaerotignum sp. MB30-C6]|uniref:hypothetical protein n=1 Tax=Anaerotignum sp. MB30-C6 TaxID=3070814 RepID=UPI0027DB62B3|nr:hypothetical protein [Anaerotignum sp. MB30-C6]WMI80988.1 hypothetical protein RBQ60_14375 [Anaerotignum sp. MB30-C6]
MKSNERNTIALSAVELEEKQQELEAKERELAEKESMIKKAEECMTKAKYNLYDKIDVSLGTMDKIISVVALSLVAVIIFAVLSR